MSVGKFAALVMFVPLVITLLASAPLGEKLLPLCWLLVVAALSTS